MPTTTHLPGNLKLLRQWTHASQQGAADAMGIKRSSLSGYENGSAEPSLALLCAMADHFAVTLDQLVRHDLTEWSHASINAWRSHRTIRKHQHIA